MNVLTPRGAPLPGAPVHVLAWRLYDYDGGELTQGGVQRWLVELSRLLVSLGHPVVVHQRATRSFVRQLASGVTVKGHRCPARAAATPWFNWRVHREIPRDAPVVYMAEDLAYPLCRARSVVVQHGVWWDGEYGWLRVRVAERMARRAVQRAAGTVCVDTNFINWFRARWPRAGCDEKLHYVPNFIDPEQWGCVPREPAAALAGRVTVCFPRRSEPRRGIWLMAEIAPRLARRFGDVDFRFVVGSGYHTEQLRERLAASGLPPERWRIEVLPMDRMREAYEQSQVVVIPTLCGEGTSLSAIEAMHFGCAVVSTWVGGLPNLVHDRENGLLTAPVAGQVEAALAALIADPVLRSALGRRAMATARGFHVERWRQDVARVLHDRIALPQLEVSHA